MKTHRVFASVFICILLLAMAVVVRADDPPKPAVTPSPTPTLPPKGSFEQVPVRAVLNVTIPTTAHVAELKPGSQGWPPVSVVPTPAVVPAVPPAEGNFAPAPIRPGRIERDGAQVNAQANSPSAAGGVRVASSTYLDSGFETPIHSGWSFVNTGGIGWTVVPCYPVEGSWSVWPAAWGAGLNPCSGDNYPINIDTWLVYGPFSLADAHAAALDFYFRMQTESGYDFLAWYASKDGINWSGNWASGTYTSGPFNNGYNFASLDLANVPYLGDVTGQPEVYIAFRFHSDESVTGQGPFVDGVTLRKNSDTRILLTGENFDVASFPNPAWESFDYDGATNGDYRWDDVLCFARSGGWSMWPADEGANGLDPCSPALNPYPNNARSWLVHGPFNLTGASEAWVDFYFRNQSQTDNDLFWWAASNDGSWFYGDNTSGTYTSGYDGINPVSDDSTGYNLIRFDLSAVPYLGDLRGQPNVWLAFVFNSDASTTGQGPFVDDVSVVVERNQADRVYLPFVQRTIPPQTTLYIQNSTSGSASYTVFGTPEGDITCTNIPAGQTVLCGTFTTGTYNVRVTTTECGQRTGEVDFPAGNTTRTVRCVHGS
jgi:hypothetical protein